MLDCCWFHDTNDATAGGANDGVDGGVGGGVGQECHVSNGKGGKRSVVEYVDVLVVTSVVCLGRFLLVVVAMGTILDDSSLAVVQWRWCSALTLVHKVTKETTKRK
jgi:hypothetical protein